MSNRPKRKCSNDDSHSRPCRVPGIKGHDQQQVEPVANLVTRLAERETALKAAEVAVLLACDYAHVCKMAKRGRIPSYRIDGMVRFDPGALSIWLKSKSMGN